MIRWLISRGADACLCDFLGRTPLHIACHFENDEISTTVNIFIISVL